MDSRLRLGEKCFMQDVLLIGNGFDLYHKLPTRYTDFLFLVKNWDYFYREYSYNIKNDSYKPNHEQIVVRVDDYGKLTKEALEDFAQNASMINPERIDLLNDIIFNNAWIKYFMKSGYEKEGWIDFESEIKNVLVYIEKIFQGDINQAAGKRLSGALEPDFVDMIKLLNESTKSLQIDLGMISEMEIRRLIFGETKKKLLEELYLALNDLIESLDIYLGEFVENIKPRVYSEQIKALLSVNILNFNYTYTYKSVYGDTKRNQHHHIHGSLLGKNIVLGMSDKDFDNLDYIYFQKYFQRIQKRTGAFYREWIPKEFKALEDAPIDVYIMGHSLGETDKDVLSEFFLNKRAIKKITIFYHSQKAYEELVISLINLYGKEFVIEETGSGRVEFVELKEAAEGSGKGSY